MVSRQPSAYLRIPGFARPGCEMRALSLPEASDLRYRTVEDVPQQLWALFTGKRTSSKNS